MVESGVKHHKTKSNQTTTFYSEFTLPTSSYVKLLSPDTQNKLHRIMLNTIIFSK